MTLRLNGATSGYTEIDAPAVAGNNNLKLPTGNGTSGQSLTTDGSGNLSWASKLGEGQTWQNVTASRAIGVTYTNTTGRPIMVAFVMFVNNTSGAGTSLSVNGVLIASSIGSAAGIGMAQQVSYSVIVPAGSTYIAANAMPSVWAELR